MARAFFASSRAVPAAAKRDNTYPELKEGDPVRANIQPKSGIANGHEPKWTKSIYNIIAVG
eukprot:8093560-Heterocapsa_arctica.AAC.1